MSTIIKTKVVPTSAEKFCTSCNVFLLVMVILLRCLKRKR